MSTPNLKKLLLPVAGPGRTADRWSIGWNDCLRVIEQNIERLEAEAVEAFGQMNLGGTMTYSVGAPSKKDSHSTWIFPQLTEEIKSGVTVEEMREAFRRLSDEMTSDAIKHAQEINERIKKEGFRS